MDQRTPLPLMTLDSQKAFDVVNHTILLDNLYEEGIQPSLWTIVKDLYSGPSSKVNWIGDLSESFVYNKESGKEPYFPFLSITYI